MINFVSGSTRPPAVLALFFLALFPVLTRGEVPILTGTMPEDQMPGLRTILDTALKQSPQMIGRQIELSQTEAARYFSDAARWPDLGGSVSYESSQQAVSSNTDSKSKNSGLFYSLSLGQSIFQWGALKNQSEIARIAVVISEKNYAETYRLLAYSLRSQYLALVVKKANIYNIKFRHKLAESALEVEEAKLKNGTISVGEIILPRLNLSESQLATDRLEADYENSKRLLAHMAGFADLPEEMIAKEIPATTYSADRASALYAYLAKDQAQSTFQVEIYTLNLRQADLTYRIAKVRLLPKFYVGASTSLSNSSSVTSVSTVAQTAVSSQSVNVNAQWRIFDGFATRGAKLSALASKRYYDQLLKTQVQTTLDQAQNQMKMLPLSARATELSEQRRQLAEASVQRYTEEVKLGNAPQTVADDSLANFYAAQVSAYSVRAEYLGRWCELVSLAGADPAMNNLPARYVR